jgi:hypothetical protein
MKENQRVDQGEGRCIGISEFSIDKEIKLIAERVYNVKQRWE